MSEGQNQGQNLSLIQREIWENVPRGPEEQVQVQGGYASAPCNPVTLSFTLDLEVLSLEMKTKINVEEGYGN